MSRSSATATSVSRRPAALVRPLLTWLHGVPREHIILTLLIAGYTVVLSAYTLARHYTFNSANDLGLLNQALWTTAHKGLFFYYTAEPFDPDGASYFRSHFSPILFLLVPLYHLFPGPPLLLSVQSLVLGLTAAPLYLLARDELGDRRLGLGFAALYLVHPPLIYQNLFDFHPQAFLPLFLTLGLYNLRRRAWRPYMASLTLALAVIEFVPVLVAGLSLYLAALGINRRYGGQPSRSLFAFSLTSLVLAGTWFAGAWHVRALHQDPSFSFAPWAQLGRDLPGIVSTFAVEPHKVAAAMLTARADKALLLVHVFAPLLFLPLLSPRVLLALPWLLAATTSNWFIHYSPFLHYGSFTFPFLFFAGVGSIKRLAQGAQGALRLVALALIVSLLFLMLFPSPVGGLAPDAQHNAEVAAVINLVPAEASVFTQNNLYPHVSSRTSAYLFLRPHVVPEVVLGDAKSSWFQTPIMPGLPSFADALAQLLTRGEHGLLAWADGAFIFQRGFHGPPVLLRPYVIPPTDLTATSSAALRVDPSSEFGKSLEYRGPPGIAWYGPYMFLPPGNYVALFKLRLLQAATGAVAVLEVTDRAGTLLLAQRSVDAGELRGSLGWHAVEVPFTLTHITTGLEFRGVEVRAILALHSVEIHRIS